MRRDDNLTTFMCRPSRSSGTLIFLEPQGSLQVCVGNTIPIYPVLLRTVVTGRNLIMRLRRVSLVSLVFSDHILVFIRIALEQQ